MGNSALKTECRILNCTNRQFLFFDAHEFRSRDGQFIQYYDDNSKQYSNLAKIKDGKANLIDQRLLKINKELKINWVGNQFTVTVENDQTKQDSDQLDELIRDCKNYKINIAIFGPSSSGKSSFIATFEQIIAKSPNFYSAYLGIKDKRGTTKIQKIPLKNTLINFIDLPGIEEDSNQWGSKWDNFLSNKQNLKYINFIDVDEPNNIVINKNIGKQDSIHCFVYIKNLNTKKKMQSPYDKNINIFIQAVNDCKLLFNQLFLNNIIY